MIDADGDAPMEVIDDFRGEHRFLSNFFFAEVCLDDVTYPSVEHAYQAAKTLDHEERETVRLAPTCGSAKRRGRHVTLRPDWEEVKLGVMLSLLRQKFAKGSDLARKLDETGTAKLVEGNWWGDTYWGVYGGEGHNHLGRALMLVRGENRVRS